jgi:hypothetical protein
LCLQEHAAEPLAFDKTNHGVDESNGKIKETLLIRAMISDSRGNVRELNAENFPKPIISRGSYIIMEDE